MAADSVVWSVDALLAEAAGAQAQCRERSAGLSASAQELRRDTQSLRARCESAQLHVAGLRRTLDELLDTKQTFETRERQTRKLSKQL